MIGRKGEKRFETLCSDAGVTCNRSIEDDFGWDKLVEFPARKIPFAAIDMQPANVIAAVQVKTTETASRSVMLNLSNALHYVKSSVPQFIVLVALDGTKPRYFARHVWGSLVADWLKAGRQADADGLTGTHRRRITLKFTPEDERDETLLDWIRSEIEGIQSPYSATKKAFVDTIGFESTRGIAQLTFAAEGPLAKLDFQLGLRPYLEAKRFVFISERFGIRAGRPEIDVDDVRVYFTPEGRSCALRLEFPGGGSVIIPSTLYSASTETSFAFRVTSRALDATFGPGGHQHAQAQMQRDARVTLDELRAFAHLLAAKPNANIAIELSIDGRIIELGTVRIKEHMQADGWEWMALGMDVIRAIATEACQSASDLTIGEIEDANKQLNILSALASERAVRVDFTPEPDAPLVFNGFLAYASASVGDQVFAGVAYRPVALDQLLNDSRRITLGPAKLVWGGVVPKAVWDDSAMRAAYQRHLDRYSETVEIMALGNLQDVVDKGTGDQVLKSDLPAGHKRLQHPQVKNSNDKK